MNATLELLEAEARAAGWTVTPMACSQPIACALRFEHPDHPAVRLDALELSVAPHFRGRLLLNRRERSVFASPDDLTPILADPSRVS